MSTIKVVAKSLFGKDHSAIWKQFALDVEGKYGISPSGEDQVVFNYGDLSVIIDQFVSATAGGSAYESVYLRARVQFVSADQMIFCLTKQGFFENIGIFFGAQDDIVGDSSFDEQFMIKGNDETAIQFFFSDTLLKRKLEMSNLLRVELTNKEGLFFEPVDDGKHMLYLVSKKEVKSLNQLYNFSNLFKFLIDDLVKLGSIKN